MGGRKTYLSMSYLPYLGLLFDVNLYKKRTLNLNKVGVLFIVAII